VSILEKINSPCDLKKLSLEILPILAAEIREEILSVVSKNGGHLASSLGVVELSIALHYVFNSPIDAIVWDVGHQSYTHKLLTGRRDRFSTLRMSGGLTGFTSRTESPHDIFGTGHASTSISASVGIEEGRRITGKKGRVIAVIGDGAMSGGLAFEGLNFAGHLEKDLIVVLNDNEMSISPNVGALSSWFSRKFTSDFYKQYRRRIKSFLLSRFPRGGSEAIMLLRRAIDSTKVLLTPGILFEGFNFQYVGPIDGHDIKELIDVISSVKDLEGPVLIHVRTKKGKGYRFAEKEPSRFHGIGAFDLSTGKTLKNIRSYTQAFSDALVEEAMYRPEIAAITAAMADGTGLLKFQQKYPERFYDVGIAESHAVTFAAGLATQGVIPVVAVYSTFLQRAFDQIIHDVALQNLHVIFVLDRAGLVGQDGSTHSGTFDLTYARMIPNVTIMAPSDEAELQNMLKSAIDYTGPCFIRYPRGTVPSNTAVKIPVVLERGKARMIVKPQKKAEVIILAIGSRVIPAVQAAKLLGEKGIIAAVIDARFVKPLDDELIISSLSDTHVLVTVEENTLAGGFGSAVLEMLIKNAMVPKKIKCLGIPDRFIPHGERSKLLSDLGLDAEGIANEAEKLIAS